jgi:glucosamine 6-phosphate synthetase-like amidotransferase/phosphosugar isomerase protein
MSAIIYRAPDSTGIGIFGNDADPVRARKSLGSVYQLVDVLIRTPFYASPVQDLISFDVEDGSPLHERQRKLLAFERLPLNHYESCRAKNAYVCFDELVRFDHGPFPRLTPGYAGRPTPLPVFTVKTKTDLRSLIDQLTSQYDLSFVVIQSLLRNTLSQVLAQAQEEEKHLPEPSEILAALDRLLEGIFFKERLPRPTRLDYGWAPGSPQAEKALWRYLARVSVQIPADYDRDGVRCVFRLLDAALLCRLAHERALEEKLQAFLEKTWPGELPVLWRGLYQAEKSANVYGRAAAAALGFLQREELPSKPLFVNFGDTDPVSLQYFASPILSQGRWALQAPVTLKNAHPFFDAPRQRIIVLNGQFNPQVESQLHDFLEQVAGVSFRSENSSEYFALLWGYLFDLLRAEKNRYEAIRAQIDSGLEEYSIGSQSIDYQIYHRVQGKSLADLDQLAFLEAVRRIAREGGQLAVAGMSLFSPRRLYVAGHNRPVFVVHRLDNDDHMVVSDINAAIGLFPQEFIHRKVLKLKNLRARKTKTLERLEAEGGPKQQAVAEYKKTFQKEEEKLLDTFRVAVFPMEGEEIFACIEARIKDGSVSREVRITDFDGRPLPDVEPFHTVLHPLQVKKDLHRSFYETHLYEIPEKLEDILRFYEVQEEGLPRFEIREGLLRRRFGHDLGLLKRLVLVGMGSAYHMGLVAKRFIQHLLPELEVSVLRPVEVDDIHRALVPEKDLVVLLSWSGTTADMVHFAQRLESRHVLMIGITEKQFADMGLIARKSGGVIPVLSGEEVTVPGIKSTICTLFCLDLLALWLCATMGRKEKAKKVMATLQHVPEVLTQVLNDEAVERFSKKLASRSAQSYAAVLVDALHSTGTALEAALKLEEAGWTAIGKAFDYSDFSLHGLKKSLDKNLVLVSATDEARLPEALGVIRALYLAAVPFAVVTCHNGSQSEIEDYNPDHCVYLPKLTHKLQPFVDLVFYYRFAFYHGLAHGRSTEDFPRNRAKSITAARTPASQSLSPAKELFELGQRDSLLSDAPLPRAALSRRSAWERETADTQEKIYYQGMRKLAEKITTKDPLKGLLKGPVPEGLILDGGSEETEILFVPLDRAAEGATRNVADQWGRYLDCTMKIVSPYEPEAPLREEVPVIFVASEDPDEGILSRLLEPAPQKRLWFGSELPRDQAEGFERGLGYLPVRDDIVKNGQDDLLYAGLCFLLMKAFAKTQPPKIRTLERHFRKSALLILNVLADGELRRTALDAMHANATYRTAFFIGHSAGIGHSWVRRFDERGNLTTVWHLLGESVHGPLVTVDPQVEQKFVQLLPRDHMVSTYGREHVSKWEDRYWHGKTVDDFLGGAVGPAPQGPRPFFAEGNWYLPVLRDDYNGVQDNLIVLDATSNRHFGRALDELATFGCRYARMIVIAQEAFRNGPGKDPFAHYPISHLIVLPSFTQSGEKVPISGLVLPFALNLLATAMAAAGDKDVTSNHGVKKP